MQYSQKQYSARDADAIKAPFWIPEEFDETEHINWSGGWSLTHKRAALLPTSICYYDAPVEGRDFCLADSNGCAAGNVFEEAIFHGLLELVERDALAIWWYNRVHRPAVDVSKLSPPVRQKIETLEQHLHSENRVLSFIDLTNDLGIPVFGAVSWDKDTGANITFGFGAHLDVSIAASRAASELVQLDIYCTEASNSRLALRMSHVKQWFASATIHNHSHLVPSESAVPALSCALEISSDLRTNIEKMVAHLSQFDIEVLVVNLTREDLDFPVARVVAPGLRHYHNRFDLGRLYEVPVSLGWLTKQNAESDLNSTVYFA